jgi:SAM-dependent methyltransferase
VSGRIIEGVHGGYVTGRRAGVLSRHLAELLPESAEVLDVGTGDGRLAERILERRPGLRFRGVDVALRGAPGFPVERFDGRRIPHADASFDVVLVVDVLHHCASPMELLGECARVARDAVLLKDHDESGWLARPTLRLMDWVGNARHGVALPYNYWPEARWRSAFDELGLRVTAWRRELRLYPWPADWIFGRSLHFIARLAVRGRS